MRTVVLALAVALLGAPATAPHPPPRAVWMRQACAIEDGVDCFWNATEQGDRHGRSFYVHSFPGGLTCTMYVDVRYAHTHDRCSLAGGRRPGMQRPASDTEDP